MVLRFEGTRRPGLVDCEGVETCWGVCCLSALARLLLVVLMDSIAECRGWWDMLEVRCWGNRLRCELFDVDQPRRLS